MWIPGDPYFRWKLPLVLEVATGSCASTQEFLWATILYHKHSKESELLSNSIFDDLEIVAISYSWQFSSNFIEDYWFLLSPFFREVLHQIGTENLFQIHSSSSFQGVSYWWYLGRQLGSLLNRLQCLNSMVFFSKNFSYTAEVFFLN